MLEISEIPDRAQRYLLTAMHAAGDIRSRSDLYMWASGPFWAAFPHDLMLCALQDASGNVTRVECLHSVVMPPQLLADVCDTQSGFLVRLLRLCREYGVRQMSLFEPGQAVSEPYQAWAVNLANEWAGMNLGPLWWVDAGLLPGSHSSCMALVGKPLEQHRDVKPLLGLMAAPLHMAMLRTQTHTPQPTDVHTRQLSDLTERQMEIMRWVRLGKTNHEIATIMDISPFTVKNHIQKMFKRMNVHNRAQAVARSSGLL